MFKWNIVLDEAAGRVGNFEVSACTKGYGVDITVFDDGLLVVLMHGYANCTVPVIRAET